MSIVTMHGMHLIKTAQDVEHFAGKVVIYSAGSWYFAPELEDSFQMDDHNSELRAGYVGHKEGPWHYFDGPEYRYYLYCLLNQKAIHSTKVLTNRLIKCHGDLMMREATKDEYAKICELIAIHKAEWDYDADGYSEMIDILLQERVDF